MKDGSRVDIVLRKTRAGEYRGPFVGDLTFSEGSENVAEFWLGWTEGRGLVAWGISICILVVIVRMFILYWISTMPDVVAPREPNGRKLPQGVEGGLSVSDKL